MISSKLHRNLLCIVESLRRPVASLTGLLCYAILSFSPDAHATQSGLAVSVALDRATVAFDSVVVLKVDLSWPGDQLAYRFNPIQPQAERLSLLRYATTASTAGTVDSPITTKTYQFYLQPTSAGNGKILPMTILYRLATQTATDSTLGQMVTEPLSLTILEPDLSKNRREAPALIPYPLGYYLLGVLALSATFVVVLVVRSRRPRAPVINPDDELLVKIGELRAECGDDVKRFQTGVYKELVQYVSRVYRLDLSGMLTEDIVHVIDASEMPVLRKEKIGAWLLQAQRQKFSPASFSSAEVLRLEQEIRSVFERPAQSGV